MWKVRNLKIKSRVVMAPMAGISNPAFMRICESMDVGLVVSELISSEAIIRGNNKTFEMLNGLDELNVPVGIQLFGSDANTLADAAKYVEKNFKVDIIDINMGCPVHKVVSSGAGSYLLKTPEKIGEIVSSVVNAVSVPVTVKIRSGWDQFSVNAVEVAKIIEAAGASAICVHARTRSQGYDGVADWNIIKEVKESINIPVIGNGDILSCYDAKRMLDETGCDAIMIGRGLLGNPWLIKECNDYLNQGIEPSKVSNEDKITMLKKHFEYLVKDKGEYIANLEIRTQALWYVKGLPGSAQIKNQICKTKDSTELFKILDTYIGSLSD